MTAWYRTGTASITNGTDAVTGSGTAWTNQAKVGDLITFDGGAKFYEIAAVGGNTSITLVDNFAETTVSGGAYAIVRIATGWADPTDVSIKLSALLDSVEMDTATYDPAAIAEQVVGLTATQTLTNKTLTAPTISSPALGAGSVDAITEIDAALKSGADLTLITGTAGTDGDLAVWNADGDLVDGPTPPSGTIVGTTDTQTLTNKTLTAPTINGATINTTTLASPTITGTPVLPAGAIDAITEIDAALKSGADATLITGTAGTDGNVPQWNTDGDLVDSGKTWVGADTGILTGTAGTDGDLAVWNADGDLVDGPTPPSGAIVGTTDTQTLTNKTLTSPVINTGISGTAVLDEDDMASDSATQVPTQQSVKAYVDSRPAGVPDVIVQDQKASGTDGGTATSGSWQTRDLTTLVRNNGTIASLGSNQITLGAGTYFVRWSAPANDVGVHQSRLYNATDAASVAIGTTEYNGTALQAQSRSHGVAVVTIAASKAFEIQHQVTTTSSGTYGYGDAGSFGTEVYTMVEITQIS